MRDILPGKVSETAARLEDADKRRRYRIYHLERAALFAVYAANGYRGPAPAIAPIPYDLRALACGARTRAGSPCKRTDIFLNGRCKFHGGLSTGPRSSDGRQAAKANLARRWLRNPVKG